jgi:hypothetical protein
MNVKEIIREFLPEVFDTAISIYPTDSDVSFNDVIVGFCTKNIYARLLRFSSYFSTPIEQPLVEIEVKKYAKEIFGW